MNIDRIVCWLGCHSWVTLNVEEREAPVPRNPGVTRLDRVRMSVCVDCGAHGELITHTAIRSCNPLHEED
jgi:hypothetical protein